MLGCGLEKLLCSGWSMHNWIEKIVHFLEVLKLISWSCLQDVFYNDMRNPKAIDYSEPIIKWTRETKEAAERWKAVGGAGGGRKSFGTTNQNSDSVSLPSFRWYSLVFSVCPASFDAVQEGSQTCTDLGSAICLHIGPMKDAKYGDHVSLDSKFEVGVNAMISCRTASMADTSFSDLQLRIGSQYLYCHQVSYSPVTDWYPPHSVPANMSAAWQIWSSDDASFFSGRLQAHAGNSGHKIDTSWRCPESCCLSSAKMASTCTNPQV
jgi:hypothetical protein